VATTIPNLDRLEELRGQKVKLLLNDGQSYICVPRDYVPLRGSVGYALEIAEGEDQGYFLEVMEDEIKEIQII